MSGVSNHTELAMMDHIVEHRYNEIYEETEALWTLCGQTREHMEHTWSMLMKTITQRIIGQPFFFATTQTKLSVSN